MEASAINEPHPDDQPADEADLFFGDPEPATPDEPAPAEEPGAEETPAEEPMAEIPAKPAPAEEPVAESPPAVDPTPASPSTSAEPETPSTNGGTAGQTTTAPVASAGQIERGAAEREYLVFHKVRLTASALRFLLDEIEQGNAPEPRVAYLHLHTASARKVEGALADAYVQHQAVLGAECELAGVSERAFQTRHVKPKPNRAEANVSIT